MEEIIILNNEYVTLKCYPDKKIIHHQFHQFTYDEAFAEVFERGLEAFKKHNCTKWLSDDRKLGTVNPDDMKKGGKVWLQKMIKSGWTSWAVLEPEKATGKMSLQRMASMYAQNGVTEVSHWLNTTVLFNIL